MLELANIGLATAFLAGLISFASPCVLPLVPGYLSFVAGRSLGQIREADRRERLRVLTQSIWFVLGFTTIFLMLGASATAIGRLLLIYRQEANLVGGLIVILFHTLLPAFFTALQPNPPPLHGNTEGEFSAVHPNHKGVFINIHTRCLPVVPTLTSLHPTLCNASTLPTGTISTPSRWPAEQPA